MEFLKKWSASEHLFLELPYKVKLYYKVGKIMYSSRKLNKIALTKQRTFPSLKCIKSPTHKIKDTELNVEKDVPSLEVGKEYEIKRTELKESNHDLYLVVGSIDGLLFMNEEEIKSHFDVSVLNSLGLKVWDAPFFKTGMQIEEKEEKQNSDLRDVRNLE